MPEAVRLLRHLVVGTALLATAALAPLPSVTQPDGAAAATPAPTTAPKAAPANDACGATIAKPGGGQWQCTFADDFGGTRLDRTKWIVQDTARTGFRTGSTCYQPDRKNVAVKRGALRLNALKGDQFRCGNLLRGFSTRYTGGMVGTKGKFSQTYGRFEVRAKWPSADTSGIHGGFWMYPVDDVYGRWPESGELDVAEWWSSRPRLSLPSLHYDGRDKEVDSGWRCKVRTPTRFHRYALVWQKNVMRFSIDGKECFARRWRPEAPQQRPQPFDHPFSLILNMGVGRKVGRQKVTAETEFPARYVVDYAKAWR
jgi:beta-glucanase (GH16 family)